jgi:hypothetical protein
MLARQDGTRPRHWNDYYRVREACQAVEERLGLRRTAPADRTAERRPTRAEHEKACQRGRSEAPRITLRRAVSTVAAGAASEEEFFARLRNAGVLVRVRYSSSSNPGQVTGYAVALAGDTAQAGGPVWFGGGKLAADVSLPKLRARWRGTPAGPRLSDPLTAAEQNAVWEHATRAAEHARAEIRRCAATDPGAASDAAWAASDTLHAAASALRSRELRRAADSYARAARIPLRPDAPPHLSGRTPAPSGPAAVPRRARQPGQYCRPRRVDPPARRGPYRPGSRPSNRSRPEVGGTAVAIIRSSEVLPAPWGPAARTPLGQPAGPPPPPPWSGRTAGSDR